MNCVGIDFCDKKNCLEQERCVLNVPRHIEWDEPKRGPKKKKKKRVRVEPKCVFGKIPCNKERICAILGECVLEHSLIKDNPEIRERLKKSTSILTVLRIFNKLKPPLTIRGQLKNYRSRR